MIQVCEPVSLIEGRRTSLVPVQSTRIAKAPTNARSRCTALGEKEARAVELVFSALGHGSSVACRVCSTRDDLYAAFRLVYHEYLRSGLMMANAAEMRITPYHLLPTTEVLVALECGRIACTASIVGDSAECGLPMESVYHEEVATLRLQGQSLVEVSCLAERHEATDKSQSPVFQLFPLVAQLAYRRGADQLVIAVHPRHARFYQRFLGFSLIAEERYYGKVCGKPAVALAMDLNALVVNHPRVHQWLFGKPFPRAVMDYRPLPNGLLEEMRRVVACCLGGSSVSAPLAIEMAL
jgi:hypothetical protein